ncbi:hypothetical protein MNBD_IGNAVI01-396 [hydrothermal vent metagenome]|uniref:RelE/StbE replicon stabilization toxin n=1 Tax=hydrothermal vent metagenome TaxID=652676 RepID=A0A3B1CDJ6_9ZZZZ
MIKKYNIEIKRSAEKEIKKLNKSELKRVLKKIDDLSTNPKGHDSIKLSNKNEYRVRVGKYRILYEILDQTFTIVVVKVGHRKNVYDF